MVSSYFASSFSQKYANGVGGVHIFDLKIIIFRPSCENTNFTKSAPLPSRLIVFDVYVETCSKRAKKHMLDRRWLVGARAIGPDEDTPTQPMGRMQHVTVSGCFLIV